MAAYNGARYIKEQIDSILPSLGENDEIVVSMDPSSDETESIVSEYAGKDSRIRKVVNEGKHGVVSNFCNAIANCRGRYIFLCDQDDIWAEDKILKVIDRFEKEGAWLVIHDGAIGDAEGKDTGMTLFELTHISTDPWRNFYKGTYWGCCMAFSAKLVPAILPINPKLRHDLFIGILTGFLKKKIVLINEKLIIHRIHGDNLTEAGRRSMPLVIADRIRLLFTLITRIIKYGKRV